MSDHRNSTALRNVKTGAEVEPGVYYDERDLAVGKAMRGLESSVHGLANITSIMSDLVFDTFAGRDGYIASLEEQDRALFCVNEVTSRVAILKRDYLQALDAGKESHASGPSSVSTVAIERIEFQEPVASTTDGSARGFAAEMVKDLDLSGVSDTGWIAVYDGLTLAAHGIEGIMQRPQCQGRDELNAAGLYLQAISAFLYNERRRAMEMLVRRPFDPAKDPSFESMMALQWLAYESNGEQFDELESFVTIARDRHRAHEEYRTGKVVRA